MACRPQCPDAKFWSATGKLKGNSLVVDFSSRGGDKDIEAKKTADGLAFSDGTSWKRVVLTPMQQSLLFPESNALSAI